MQKLSVIIPTRNRDKLLRKTLVSLANQTFINNFEVIICNDGGRLDTKNVAEDFKSQLNIKYYRLEDEGSFSCASARNYGAERSRADFLLFLDDDILLPCNAIEKMYQWLIKFHHRKNKYYVTPKSRLFVHDKFPEEIIKSDFKKISKYHIDNYRSGVTLSCAGLIYRKLFEKIYGFDEILFKGLQLSDIDAIKRLRGFFDVKNKIKPFEVYHIDNNPYHNARDCQAIRRKLISKQLINEKLIMMGFKLLNENPVKDYENFSPAHYKDILNNRKYLENISKKLRKHLKLYDHPANYWKFNLKK